VLRIGPLLKALLWAVPTYTATFVAVLWARGFDPRTEVLTGKFSFDWMCHYWNVWRFGQILTGEQPLFHTPSVFYPEGLDTLPQFPDVATMLFAGSLVPTLGVEGGVLGLAVLVVLGNAIGGFVLAFTLTNSRFAALVCGLLMAFNNYTAWAIDTGNYEYACWIGICLFFTAMERLFHRPTWWRAILTGGALALAAYINLPTFLPLLLMTLLLAFGWHAEQERANEGIGRRRIAFVAAVGLAALLVAPTAAIYSHQTDDRSFVPEYFPHYQMGFVYYHARDVHIEIGPSCDPEAGRHPKPAARSPLQPGEYYFFHIAAALWLLTAASVCRFRHTARWLLAGGFLYAVAFGPLLAVRLGSWNPGHALNIPMPYWWLQTALPLGDRFQHYDRQMSLVLVGFSVASAYSAAYLAGLRKGLQRALICVILIAAVAANLLPDWPIRSRDKIPHEPFHEFLAKQESRGAIIQVPFDFTNVDAFHLIGQTRHGRAMLNGVYPPYFSDDPTEGLIQRNQLLREVADLQASMFEGKVFRDMSFDKHGEIAIPPAFDPTEDARDLIEAGFAYLIIYRRLPVFVEDIPATELETEEMEAFLGDLLGEPLAASDSLVVYQLRGGRPRPQRQMLKKAKQAAQ